MSLISDFFLLSEALDKLGQEKFDAIYDYLKKTRFDDRPSLLSSSSTPSPTREDAEELIDEMKVMRDLRRICSDSDLCAVVEQLLFLEMSSSI